MAAQAGGGGEELESTRAIVERCLGLSTVRGAFSPTFCPWDSVFVLGFLPGFLFFLGPLRRVRKKVDGLILSLRQISSTGRPWLL
jgi:hypothetical protein